MALGCDFEALKDSDVGVNCAVLQGSERWRQARSLTRMDGSTGSTSLGWPPKVLILVFGMKPRKERSKGTERNLYLVF